MDGEEPGEDPDELDDEEGRDPEESGESVTIEISGLSLYTNHGVTEAEVLADIERRDQRDKTRAISPLRKARDAYLLDTILANLGVEVRMIRASRSSGQ